MVDLGRVGQLLSIYNIIRYEGSIAYLNFSVYGNVRAEVRSQGSEVRDQVLGGKGQRIKD